LELENFVDIDLIGIKIMRGGGGGAKQDRDIFAMQLSVR
jgi:hypothetical protein